MRENLLDRDCISNENTNGFTCTFIRNIYGSDKAAMNSTTPRGRRAATACTRRHVIARDKSTVLVLACICRPQKECGKRSGSRCRDCEV